ncbi:RNA-guided endonuclease TnpB family protein [Methylophaga sp.]|uniref:RNA-guided endonuclease InsQ/TnpB family protein n=1 Tax=Methylophaga sp. TaxID=2024840 RepID=UPI0013FED876|nr:RNA-guided endonuclease TnpB family protein [Methylophaga sp.]MTI64353.1 IS200/IS605 family element transposase accessory protein TnpB [Methylophaga sp.]
MIQRSYRFRFYPTRAQQQQLAIEFGHARFVYNFALNARNKAWQRRKESLNYVGLSKLIGQIKKTSRFDFLRQATAACHTQKLIDLDKAFKAFFDGRARFPKFKSKHDKQSIRYQLDQRHIARAFSNTPGAESIQLPKLGKLKLRWSRRVAGVPKMVTLSKTASGKFYVSFSCEEVFEARPAVPMVVGLDVGIKDLVTVSTGEKIAPVKSYHKAQHKLARLQRVLARRKKGSNRRQAIRLKIARLHERIADIRRDFHHKTSSRLISENQVICLEDLNVKGMVKNHKLARALSDNALGELRRMLEYKAGWSGRDIVVVDRWYPSSKTCSCCEHKLKALPLSVRQWRCLKCETLHDRDINAANNILTEGLKQYREVHGNCPFWGAGIVPDDASAYTPSMGINGQGVRRVA